MGRPEPPKSLGRKLKKSASDEVKVIKRLKDRNNNTSLSHLKQHNFIMTLNRKLSQGIFFYLYFFLVRFRNYVSDCHGEMEVHKCVTKAVGFYLSSALLMFELVQICHDVFKPIDLRNKTEMILFFAVWIYFVIYNIFLLFGNVTIYIVGIA